MICNRKLLPISGVAILAFGALGAITLVTDVSAQIVHNNNVVIDGSLCVGFDCPSSPTFGFDTIQLRENNLRILAFDTSSAASFPTGDWLIEFNSSSNGGLSYFKVRDCGNTASTNSTCNGTSQFTIEAGADNDSIYVRNAGSQGGNVGFGTSIPVQDLHALAGDTPTLRLQQDGSSGFAPQTWDVAGNETNFFIRDVTNGSQLPFRIRPGAPTSAIDIAADGDVGIGTASPAAALHVRRTNGTGRILVEDTGAAFGVQLELQKNGTPRIRFDDTGSNASDSEWDIGMDASDNFIIRTFQGGSIVFSLTSAGNLTIAGGLITTGGGGACTAGDPCDLVFDPSVYSVPSIRDHAKQMWANQYLPAVGPTKAGEPFNVTIKLTRMLNELEKAHIYIEQLETGQRELSSLTGQLQTRLEALESAGK